MSIKQHFVALRIHLLPVIIVFILICIYFAPMFSGKTLVQSDNIQLKGTNSEVTEYREQGEEIRWTNKEFSGLPVTGGSTYDVFWRINQLLYYGIFPKPVMMVFTLFIGFYLLMQFFNVSPWLSCMGGFAFAFSTFNIVSLEAGHDNKVLAIAFMAPILYGVFKAYQGEYLKGGIATMLGAGFQLLYGHVQITYYLLIMVLAYLIIVIVETAKSKNWNDFLKATGILTVSTLIALGCNSSKLYSLYEYSSYSTRGGSELSSKKAEGGGLDKDYALQWSNGKMESFTLLFPYFYGGATGESLDNDSETFKALNSRGVDPSTINRVVNQVPLYWGSQPFTAGPIYFGVIIMFLFLVGMLIVKHPIKWWALALLVLSLMLAMGKNLEWFTDLFFYYVPLYNKFRSVTMILSIAQLVVPVMAVIALHHLLTSQENKKDVIKKVFISAGVFIGLGLFFLMFKSVLFDFSGANDANYGFPDWLINAIVEDRMTKFNGSIVRGIFLVIIVSGLLLVYLKGLLKYSFLVIGLSLLVFFDLWSVNKRYLDSNDFQTTRKFNNQALQASQADRAILQDTGYYRVFNLTGNPFADGVTSYHHFSIGGYSAIKMQRYQELIDEYLSKMNQPILNMLNAKYFIVPDENGQPKAQRNGGALGNAWLVKQLKLVKNADEELKALGSMDVRNEVIIDERFEGELTNKSKTFSGEGAISLVQYHPEVMKYSFNSSEDQFAVFSEIYYAPGWTAYIDNNEVPHIRVNYVLRGMSIPAGKHEIVFKYEPISQTTMHGLTLFSDFLVVVFIGLSIVLSMKSTKKD